VFDFRILGPVEVLQHGRPIELGPRRQRLVLVRLMLDAGRLVSVDRLIDDVWGGEPPAGALRTLRSYLSRLRNALGADDVIGSRSGGYVLDVDPVSVDAHRFESLLIEGRELLRHHNARAAGARLREALSLWRGAPLADLPLEPFVVDEAARLKEQRLAAVEERIDADLAVGRDADVVAELELLAEQHPLRERLWGQLMTALYRVGRQADALEAYRRARAVLSGELGIEPGDELRRLEAAILRHELPPADWEPPHNLPTPLTRFVGRERVVADVIGRLERERLVTLTGPGGSGKTRVALEAARAVLDRFPDGVWMVDLAPVSDPALLAETVADAVGLAERSARPAGAVVEEHLARTTALLLFDNCEHLGAPCGTYVRRLLENSPRVRVLATSREPLAVPGEMIFEVPPLPTGDGDRTGDVLDSEAVRLFLDRAPAAVPPESLPSVARICRELDGLPLAIEIAAAQTRWLSCEEIADRMADRFRLLSYWSRTAVPRHQTLRASLDWSYERLEQHERVVFHRLGVFAGGATLAAAEAVSGPAGDVFSALRRLVDMSLIFTDANLAPQRFRLLETVRQYAQERSAAAGDAEDAASRHAHFFAALAERGLQVIDTPDQARVHEDIDAEHGNIRAALEWAFRAGDAGLVGRIASGMGPYWRLRGYLDEGEMWLTRAVDLCDQESTEVRGNLLGGLGHIQLRRSDVSAARARLEEAVQVLGAAPGSTSVGRWLQQLAYCCSVQGELARAREVIDEALRLAVANGNSAAASHHVGHLAEIALAEGRLDEAEKLFDRALGLVAPPSPSHLVAYLESTARLAIARREFDEAAARAGEGLARAQELGDVLHIGLNLITLSYVDVRRKEVDRAAERLLEALERVWPVGEVWATAALFDVLNALLSARDENATAATARGVADALRKDLSWQPGFPSWVRTDDDPLRAALGERAYAAAVSRGMAMTREDALDFARVSLCGPQERRFPRA